MICFISGGITNVPDYQQKFEKACEELRSLGFTPFNPAAMTLPLVEWGVPETADFWLPIDFEAVKQCDCLYHLIGWQDSNGSKKEHYIAQAHGIPIIYQENLEYYKSLSLEDLVKELYK